MTEPFVVCRTSDQELARTRDLFDLIPHQGKVALDIGARDGYLSKLLAERFEHVVALDLDKPAIDHPRIEAVKGDASKLDFSKNAFDLVVCAEVLEHIPPQLLEQVAREIFRVAKLYVVIGVPFEQDLRVGRTTCQSCHQVNPPYGHVNSFGEARLKHLFAGLELTKTSLVGSNRNRTNALSAWLMDFAGNPYGSYDQEERCICCNGKLIRPNNRTLMQKVATKLAVNLNDIQNLLSRSHANWIHLQFEKRSVPAE